MTYSEQTAHKYPKTTSKVFDDHGMTCFTNSDDSVSAWIPQAQDGRIAGYLLVTANNPDQAKVHLGY